MDSCLRCLIAIYLAVKCCKSQITYCKVSVDSVTVVTSCPKFKEEWDIAAREKNCSKMATQQTCAAAEKFKYHCVINGYRNALLEVCAPERLILGHCTEFNVIGGVIQDHPTAPCYNRSFPKCDRFYYSTEAYKYPDCYNLVKRTSTPRKTPTDSNSIWLLIAAVVAITAVVTIILIYVGHLVYLKMKGLYTNVQKRAKYTYNSRQRGREEVAFIRTSASSVTNDQRQSSASIGSADSHPDKRASDSTKYDELLLKIPKNTNSVKDYLK